MCVMTLCHTSATRSLQDGTTSFGRRHRSKRLYCRYTGSYVDSGWRDLEALHLSHTSIGDEDISLLAEVAFMDKLREIDFSETRVSRKRAALLRSKSPFGDQLKIKIARYEEI